MHSLALSLLEDWLGCQFAFEHNMMSVMGGVVQTIVCVSVGLLSKKSVMMIICLTERESECVWERVTVYA